MMIETEAGRVNRRRQRLLFDSVAALYDASPKRLCHVQATSFEDLAAEDGSFDAIVAADAFHWIDPELRFSKSARLLSPSGWLAVLSFQHIYDEPLQTALQKMWVARSDDGGS